MCIASHWPAGVKINYDALMNGAEMNDDGHGFAIASREGGIDIYRSMVIEDTLAELEKKKRDHGDNSIVVFHSRWATHGVTSEYNVHPFFTDGSGDTIMVHNGVLPTKYHPRGSDPRSDTRIFADRVLSEYTINGVPSRRKSKELGRLIGTGNKLIFLSVAGGEPKARIVNAYLGEHAHGAWFSNSGYLPSQWGWRGWKDSTVTIGRREDAQSAWGAAVEVDYHRNLACEFCEAIGGIDPDTQVCAYCEMCHDCQMYLDDCLCYSSATSLWRPSEYDATV